MYICTHIETKIMKQYSSLPCMLKCISIRSHFKICLPASRVAQQFSAAFSPGRDPGDRGSNPTSGSRCMDPASPSACVSASLSLCVTIIKK